jgi:glucose/arabinose dehydrogenase
VDAAAAAHRAARVQRDRLRRDLDHPRWLYTLPNGDVLVAETNAPPKPDDGKGSRAWS